jgi:ribose transport system ATP-binding protein
VTADGAGVNGTSAAVAALALVRLTGIEKSFAGVPVLRGLDLDLRPGQIHGLVGQNGSGKSTLVKILAGYHKPDAGTAVIRGVTMSWPLPNSKSLGLAVIHQDLALNERMSVLENFGVQSRYGARGVRPIIWSAEAKALRTREEPLGIALPEREELTTVPSMVRAMTSILRALRVADESGHQVPILVLDEPTVYLAEAERDRLFSALRQIAAAGGSVLIVSHRLREVLSICDSITVLRNGQVAAVVGPGTDLREVASLMVGRAIESFYPPKHVPAELEKAGTTNALTAEGVSARRLVNFGMRIGQGEILGITGLAGMGQDEVPYALSDAGRCRRGGRGTVSVNGRPVPKRNPARMRRAGVALVPANRGRDGIWAAGSAIENLTISKLRTHEGRWWIGGQARRKAAVAVLTEFGVSPADPRLPLSAFSGGNQQKIVLARWMARGDPRVLILHEPTQGVDVGSRRQILEMLVEAARRGAAVLICASDHEEIAAMCSRVIVLEDGKIKGELHGDEITEDAVVQLAQA